MVEKRYAVVAVGAGPAGLAAAFSAADAGRRVALVDSHPFLGGQIWRPELGKARPRPARRWIWRVEQHPRIDCFLGSTLFHAEDPSDLRIDGPNGVARLRAERLILALGARELFLPFPGWTLPGVVGAGGAQALVKSGWDLGGRRVVVAGSGPLLLAVASYLKRQGAGWVTLLEQAPKAAVRSFALRLLGHPAKTFQALGLAASLLGVPKVFSAWPVRAEGDGRVERVIVRFEGGEATLDCDLLACGFGLVPNVDVAAFLGCELTVDGSVVVDDRQRTTVEGVLGAGETTGIGGVDLAVAEGRIAGLVAAGRERRAAGHLPARDRQRSFARHLAAAFALRAELKRLADDDTVVCRCEDVTFGTVRGRRDRRDAKLKTRCGMGPCQGRVCGPALGFLLGWTAPDRVRPPIHPVTVETLVASHPSR